MREGSRIAPIQLEDFRAQWQRERAAWHERLHVDELVGLPVADAERIVVQAGGTFELRDPNALMLADQRLDRVTADVAHGRVTAASIA